MNLRSKCIRKFYAFIFLFTLIVTQRAGQEASILRPSFDKKDVNSIDPEMVLHLSIVSAGIDVAAAQEYVDQLRESKSYSFGAYLTPHLFAEKFGPTKAEYRQLQAEISKSGLSIEKIFEDRVLIQASGSVRLIENLFNTSIREFRKDGRSYYAALTSPVIPAPMKDLVSGVAGLTGWMAGVVENYQFAGSGLSPSQLQAALTPAQIKKIYGMDTVSEDGSGQTLAILDFDGYLESDIQAYINKFNITNAAPRELVLLDGFSGVPTGGSGQGETTLDVEMAYAIAPHLAKILIYEVPNSSASNGISHLLAAVANDNRAQIVSVSLGHAEPQTEAAQFQLQNTLLIQLATQGSTVFIASGDSGAYAGLTGSVAVANPGAQPYATAVGGTRVRYSSNSVYTNETSWGSSAAQRGGGGGISTIWPLPPWQKDLATSINLGSSTHRMIPDVSMNADGQVPYFYILKGVQGTATGGTSFSAPLWAAYAALINQRRNANGLPNLGFANPAIYQVARSSVYSSAFNDVNDGSTNLFYPTTVGYDLSTGWGSPKGGRLLELLASPVLPPGPPANFTINLLNE